MTNLKLQSTTDANTAYGDAGRITFYCNTDRTNTPANADGYIMALRWVSGSYVTQVYFCDAEAKLSVYMRTYDGSSWTQWTKIGGA